MADSTHWSFPTPLQPVAAEVGFDLPRALDAVVRLSSRVPEDGFTASSLGTEREGNGVVIRDDGLIVTIGYLITEAEAIWITTHDGRVVAGHPLAFDFATGMGLVLPLAPLGALRIPIQQKQGQPRAQQQHNEHHQAENDAALRLAVMLGAFQPLFGQAGFAQELGLLCLTTNAIQAAQQKLVLLRGQFARMFFRKRLRLLQCAAGQKITVTLSGFLPATKPGRQQPLGFFFADPDRIKHMGKDVVANRQRVRTIHGLVPWRGRSHSAHHQLLLYGVSRIDEHFIPGEQLAIQNEQLGFLRTLVEPFFGIA